MMFRMQGSNFFSKSKTEFACLYYILRLCFYFIFLDHFYVCMHFLESSCRSAVLLCTLPNSAKLLFSIYNVSLHYLHCIRQVVSRSLNSIHPFSQTNNIKHPPPLAAFPLSFFVHSFFGKHYFFFFCRCRRRKLISYVYASVMVCILLFVCYILCYSPPPPTKQPTNPSSKKTS